jgi:hypothetical protein
VGTSNNRTPAGAFPSRKSHRESDRPYDESVPLIPGSWPPPMKPSDRRIPEAPLDCVRPSPSLWRRTPCRPDKLGIPALVPGFPRHHSSAISP